MALTRTRAELRAEVMERGDFKAVRHPQAEVDRRLDQGTAALYRLLVQANPDLYLEYKDITVSAGTDAYALPSKPGDSYDFWQCRGVDTLEGGTWHALRRFLFAERNQLQNTSTQLETRYRIVGGYLRLRPTPAWNGTIRLWYIPAPWVFAGDSATLDGIAGWEEYVVLWAIIKGKEKDRYETKDFKEDLIMLEQTIKSQAGDGSDRSEPGRIREVGREHCLTPAGLPWP